MRRLSCRTWLLVAAAVVVIAVAGTVSAVAGASGSPRPAAARVDSRPSAPHVQSVQPTAQQRDGRGRYISAGAAERIALRVASAMGPGARVLQVRLMTAAAASKATGEPVTNFGARASPDVWLVWMRGTWRLFSCITATACPPKHNWVFYAAINARTGAGPLMGENRSDQHGPLP